jgi:5-formyltetrahydrofolate cyclo-ligase
MNNESGFQDKRQVRQNVCRIREIQGSDERQRKSEAIFCAIASMDRFAADRVRYKKIALYFTHKGEVDLTRLKEYFLQNGAECFHPVTSPDKIRMEKYNAALDEKTQCRIGAMGIQEPDPERRKTEPAELGHTEQAFVEMDWVFIPGIAFDLEGNRIGYGKGYYDRYLAEYPAGHRPLLIAPAFEFQLFDTVAHEEHDIPVDMIVTEDRIIDTKHTVPGIKLIKH